MPKTWIHAATLFLLLGVGGCRSVSWQPEVAQRVDRVDRARLEAHVRALDEIGPRPVSDAAATRATVDYISEHLRQLGYEVHEESFEVDLASQLFALVRPVDQPDAEAVEIPLAPDLTRGGPPAMRANSARLREEGWQVESYVMHASDSVETVVVPNVIATRPGRDERAQVVELGAHYDTVAYSPGADDNSTGVAVLLEVARVVADLPTGRTLRFCFFGAEEVGLIGSAVHVRGLSVEDRSRLEGLINFDGVGFTARGPGSQREPEGVPWFLSLPDEGDFVAVIGKWSSGWLGNLFEDSIDAYAPGLRYYSANRIGSWFRDAARSDHASYWRAGFPAIFLSDTGEFRNPTYHSPDDTPELLDYDFLEAVTRASAAAAMHWARIE